MVYIRFVGQRKSSNLKVEYLLPIECLSISSINEMRQHGFAIYGGRKIEKMGR